MNKPKFLIVPWVMALSTLASAAEDIAKERPLLPACEIREVVRNEKGNYDATAKATVYMVLVKDVGGFGYETVTPLQVHPNIQMELDRWGHRRANPKDPTTPTWSVQLTDQDGNISEATVENRDAVKLRARYETIGFQVEISCQDY